MNKREKWINALVDMPKAEVAKKVLPILENRDERLGKFGKENRALLRVARAAKELQYIVPDTHDAIDKGRELAKALKEAEHLLC